MPDIPTPSGDAPHGGITLGDQASVSVAGDMVSGDKITIYIQQVERDIATAKRAGRLTVMISSTARDLHEHRQEVMDACLRQGMFPIMMEHLPASDAQAISASLKMVDSADIYLGIFAYRYGYIPKQNNPAQISVTEMEYNRAVERKIPRLIFLMDKEHPIKFEDVEQGEGAPKLETFKKRLLAENIVNSFKSPADLRADVINALSNYRTADPTVFHYISDIPAPPEAYIAHPYTLLQSGSGRLIGRQTELNLLTEWVTNTRRDVQLNVPLDTHIFSIVAIGGMGKSALTWKWFNEIASQEMKPLAGRLWWSFYESDATFENFITRALAYVSKRPREEIEKIPAPERETQLLAILDREPFLFVLDGLERILIAYARMDAAHLSDDDYDQRTANYVANAYGLPASAAQSFAGEHRLRKTADPRAGAFLKKLANVHASRTVVSTRLYPAGLQSMITGEPISGCFALFLRGLNDDDALDLWRAFGVSGSRETLLPLFHSFDNHPLLIQILASEVANYRRAPRDFDRWRSNHPGFNPIGSRVADAQAHILEYALRGLTKKERRVLETIAAFRTPAQYDTLSALFVGKRKLFSSETLLDNTLQELEDRGLLGWDRHANRYDLHPIVRAVIWSNTTSDTQSSVYESLRSHFQELSKVGNANLNSMEGLTPAIELYNTLIGLERYDDAWDLFKDRLDVVTKFRLGTNRLRSELLEMLFPEGLDNMPRLNNYDRQASALSALAFAYDRVGQLSSAASLYIAHNQIRRENLEGEYLSAGMLGLSLVTVMMGTLYYSEFDVRSALLLSREQPISSTQVDCLFSLSLILDLRGINLEPELGLRRSLKISVEEITQQYEGVARGFLADLELRHNNPSSALVFADQSWELAQIERYERDLVSAARLQGTAALALNDFPTADERLHYAVNRARAVNLAEEELPALIALAELRRRQGNSQAAREHLDDVWEFAERGPYPLFHADAFNVLTQIERDAGNVDRAIEAATRAYQLSWCDGPPYAYHWGLIAAQKHLQELGAPEPILPPFDPTQHEPMPDVEINPHDEFYVDPDTLDSDV